MRKALFEVTIPLKRKEFAERRVFGFPTFIDWMREDLPKLQPGRLKAADSPKDQLDDILRVWITGRAIRFGKMFQDLMPREDEVWELKTVDLRVFGWMYQPRKFIAVFADYADLYKPPNARKSYRDAKAKVLAARRNLDLDEPKYATGTFDELISV
jgi:hypothetical protein